MKFINVRGCNGSGKTSLLRFLAKDPRCRIELVHPVIYGEGITASPTATKPVPVTITPEGLGLLGDYTPAAAGATTAGCDRIQTQEGAKDALRRAARLDGVKLVLFEGVVISTIYGPWKDWGQAEGMAWAFLDTPLAVCLARIQKRNGGKPIKEDQVADKHRTIARVREKAMADGEPVYDLEWERALTCLRAVISDLTPEVF